MEASAKRGVVISVIRWSARVIGGAIAPILLLVALGYAVEQHPNPATPLTNTLTIVWVPLVGICAVALLLALNRKWERPAVLVGVAAVLVTHVMHLIKDLFEYPFHLNHESFGNPPTSLFWVPILLYLLCWWFERRTVRPRAEAPPPDTV